MQWVPDLVIEVLSSFTQRHDQLVKLILYHKAGGGSTGALIRKTELFESCF